MPVHVHLVHVVTACTLVTNSLINHETVPCLDEHGIIHNYSAIFAEK